MIRLHKPVELLEWGIGASQGNQNWTKIATGKITQKPKFIDGLAQITISIDGNAFNKTNLDDDYIKLAQMGEGMTANSDKPGEVGMGRIKKIETANNQCVITVELNGASKFSN